VKTKTLHLAIGPVQGFVAQARRTRDLYAGSFLLSYLAGWAMWAVLRTEGGSVEFPVVTDEDKKITDPLLGVIATVAMGGSVHKEPSLGTLPNRFRARVPVSFDPVECRTAVMEAWHRIGETVWKDFVAPVAHLGREVRTTWDRQVDSFWDLTWVLGEEGDLLDRRKNWRTFAPALEDGDKCTVMGSLQELSGFIRSCGRADREKQERFWQALRSRAGSLNLRADERLCAISLIKRLYPLVAKKAIGWSLPLHYPSTSYIAAVPWIKTVIEANPPRLPEFVTLAGSISTQESPKELFPELVEAVYDHPAAGALAALDGNCFFRSALENDRLWGDNTSSARRKMVKLLADLSLEAASSFYAVLLMDGDRLGALLGGHGGQGPRVSRALAAFSVRVADIVRGHNGVTVYAGGDDVLALFPMPNVLAAAWTLREAYRRAFVDEFGPDGLGPGQGTVSAAVLFAQYHLPLKDVLAQTHRLLDEAAKEACGRDSLAVGVWKGAGRCLMCSWPWEALREGDSNLLEELAARFSGASRQEKEFNSSFFYNIRDLFGLMGECAAAGERRLQEDLLAAEYLKNRERGADREKAVTTVRRLLRLCRRSWRDDRGLHLAEGPPEFEGAMLVKFLAGRGITE